jgi:hypothetical protein
MKRLLYLGLLVFLFISLTGANSMVTPRESAQIQKVMPPNVLNSTEVTSTNEPTEILEMKKIPIIPNISELPEQSSSGDNFVEGTSMAKITAKAYSDVIDSFDLGYTSLTECEWNGRYIYNVMGFSGSDSSDILIFDPEQGSIVDIWTLPFMGASCGGAFVNNSMYIADCTNGMIRKVSPTTHTLLASFPSPGGTGTRGMTSDGTNLYIAASFSDSIYLTDTLGNVANSWYIGSFCVFSTGLAYASPDSTIWLVDANAIPPMIMKVDLKGPNAILLDAFTAPNQNTPAGIAFDGSDLWFNAHMDYKLYRIDGGYSHSRIALFQEHEPWGYRAIKDILYGSGIPFKVFGMDDMGSADLSIYTKAIVASQQDREMGDSLAAYKTWWENWISNGGVLQLSGATYTSETWEGLILPGDYSCVNNSSTLQQFVDIVSTWHPMVNYPHYIYDDSLDNWGYSSHGYLTGLSDHYTVLSDTLDRPVLAIKRLGAGGIIATQMTLEYGWGGIGCPILENVVKYWQFGVTDNVLFALADVDRPWLKYTLTSRYQEIGNVDYMDVQNYTPLLEDLLTYDAVLTHSNYSFYDPIAMGDTLAAYVDLGGNVVTCAPCWYGSPFGLEGAIMNTSYNPFSTPSGGDHFSWANLGWYDAGHPMMDGITTFSEYYRDYLAVNPGADTVAKYDDGEYLLGYKTNPSGGVVVGLNVFTEDSLGASWTGQMVRLLRNVLHWTATSGIDIQEEEEFADFKILEISASILIDNGWIRFYLNSPGKIDFKIFDVSGRAVYERNLDYAVSGRKTLDFNVSNVVSGPYFLHLSSGDRSLTRKIIVVR